MDCYKFESKISLYIDGELKQVDRNHFIRHKNTCKLCMEKFTDIQKMLGEMKKIPVIKTSQQFFYNLDRKIQSIDKEKSSLLQKIFTFKPFGLEPPYAFGMAFALGVLVISSYFLITLDSLPEINPDVIAKYKSINGNTNNTTNTNNTNTNTNNTNNTKNTTNTTTNTTNNTTIIYYYYYYYCY